MKTTPNYFPEIFIVHGANVDLPDDKFKLIPEKTHPELLNRNLISENRGPHNSALRSASTPLFWGSTTGDALLKVARIIEIKFYRKRPVITVNGEVEN